MPRRPKPYSAPGVVALPEVHFARDYLPAVVAAHVRTGAWVKVAWGAYVPQQKDEDTFVRQRRFALARIVALARLGGPDRWISHTSAALLWGLPHYGMPHRTHITHGKQPSVAKKDRANITRHSQHLPSEHRIVRLGIPLTSLARTVVDCARIATPAAAIVIADAALNRHLERGQIDEVLTAMGRRPGTARARELLALADAGADSPGETLLRIAILRGGLPAPETQIRVVTRLGTFWGDLGWERWRLILEYDGRDKYEGQGTESLIQEKRRHDAIGEAGYTILRVTKEDLAAPSTLANRIGGRLPSGASNVPPPRALRLPPTPVSSVSSVR